MSLAARAFSCCQNLCHHAIGFASNRSVPKLFRAGRTERPELARPSFFGGLWSNFGLANLSKIIVWGRIGFYWHTPGTGRRGNLIFTTHSAHVEVMNGTFQIDNAGCDRYQVVRDLLSSLIFSYIMKEFFDRRVQCMTKLNPTFAGGTITGIALSQTISRNSG